MAELTHFDDQGNAVMVDVGAKDITERSATAKGSVLVSPETMTLIQEQYPSCLMFLGSIYHMLFMRGKRIHGGRAPAVPVEQTEREIDSVGPLPRVCRTR